MGSLFVLALVTSFTLALSTVSASADSFRFAVNLGPSGPPAPPPLRVEQQWAPPSPDAIWIAGHWTWEPSRGAYVWFPGYYEYPPAPWAVYDAEHHYVHGHDHYWVHGHWKY